MPKFIDRLPYFTEATYEDVGSETVQIKPYQIIVWVSVTAADLLEWGPTIPRFPCILDPGNNHNFSIQEAHLQRWAELALKDLQPMSTIALQRQHIQCYAASVWLYPNVPGTRNVPEGAQPTRLVLPDGIPVFPQPAGREFPFPRLPLLGLRAMTDNKLDMNIQGGKRLVSIRTVGRPGRKQPGPVPSS
jgi:hypothetical protein